MGGKVGLVTGCAGMIGSHLCDALLARGWRVTGVDDLSAGNLDNLAGPLADSRFRFVQADVTRPEQLKPELFQGVDCVFHLGSRKMVFSVERPREDLLTNVYGTLNMLVQSAQSRVGRFIFASSSAVYGEPVSVPSPEDSLIRPTNPYGVSKFACEEYCRLWHRKYGLPTVVLRYTNVYGPRQALNVGVVGIFATQILGGQPITIFGDGSQVRCLTYVEDAVEATLLAAGTESPGVAGEAFNVSSGGKATVMEIAQMVGQTLGKEPRIVHKPPKPGEIKQMIPDIRKIRKMLNFNPRFTLEEGLSKTLQYYEQKHPV